MRGSIRPPHAPPLAPTRSAPHFVGRSGARGFFEAEKRGTQIKTNSTPITTAPSGGSGGANHAADLKTRDRGLL